MANVHQGSKAKSAGDTRGEHRAASSEGPPNTPIFSTTISKSERWGPHRKAEVVAAVRSGALSLKQISALYQISIEEYVCWQRDITLFGLPGLQVGKGQRLRRMLAPVPSRPPSP
jgi:hypothetical protein